MTLNTQESSFTPEVNTRSPCFFFFLSTQGIIHWNAVLLSFLLVFFPVFLWDPCCYRLCKLACSSDTKKKKKKINTVGSLTDGWEDLSRTMSPSVTKKKNTAQPREPPLLSSRIKRGLQYLKAGQSNCLGRYFVFDYDSSWQLRSSLKSPQGLGLCLCQLSNRCPG